MILRKCDMCGSMREIGDGLNQVPQVPGEAITNINIKKNEKEWDFLEYALCKDCTKKLIEWISIGRNKNEKGVNE